MTPNSFYPVTSSSPVTLNNSTTETTLIPITISANTVADGNTLEVSAQMDFHNSSGAAVSYTERIAVDGSTFTMAGGSHNSNANTSSGLRKLILARQGASLLLCEAAISQFNGIWASQIVHSWNPDFTNDFDINITGQFSVANANISASCNSATVLQY